MTTTNVCSCGRTFPATLEGAWQAREHADASHHSLDGERATRAPVRKPATNVPAR